jgi:hypothetical protein
MNTIVIVILLIGILLLFPPIAYAQTNNTKGTIKVEGTAIEKKDNLGVYDFSGIFKMSDNNNVCPSNIIEEKGTYLCPCKSCDIQLF